ncbi:hypothetical protein [Marinoscillum sp. MHG1-6]|uniref:hypothetical protein n=1 Tax=Marinoscillum sp. MHG1-6 TaxID=2959627 RepID=UPI002157D604|nr:hypothetical protein [Marinoscillum sp. MHG1-6]
MKTALQTPETKFSTSTFTLLRLALLTPFLFVAFFVHAQTGFTGDDYYYVDVTNDGLIKLTANHVRGNARVSILDQYGQVEYTDECRTSEKLDKKYDLSNIPQGNYQLKYQDDYVIRTVPFTVGDNLSVSNEKEETLILPVILQKGNSLIVRMISNDIRKMRIYIYDAHGNLLETNKITGKGSFGEQFDLTKVPSEFYKVAVWTDGEVVTKTVKIQLNEQKDEVNTSENPVIAGNP